MSKKSTAKAKYRMEKPVVHFHQIGNREEIEAALMQQRQNELYLKDASSEEKEMFNQLDQKVKHFNTHYINGKRLEKNKKLKACAKKEIEKIIKWFENSGKFDIHNSYDLNNGWAVNLSRKTDTASLEMLSAALASIEQSMQSLSMAASAVHSLVSTEALLERSAAPVILSKQEENDILLSEPDPETGERFNLNFYK
jgi:hypothetical protein